MSVLPGSHLRTGVAALLIITSAFLLISSPASAALVVTNESFSPVPPLAGGDVQHSVSTIAIIPAGATTFSRTHTLQMQTELVDAKWNIQIIVDGISAAQQSASGTSAFVNGYLLSYPTTSDVSFTVALDGTVPPVGDMNVTILQVTELATGGTPVPGSSLTVSAPLVSPLPGTVASPQVPATPPTPATPAPTRSGFFPVTGLIATVIAAAGFGCIRARRE
ncbi:MAG: hypothetical protein WCX22_12420 [Methanoregula sp.]